MRCARPTGSDRILITPGNTATRTILQRSRPKLQCPTRRPDRLAGMTSGSASNRVDQRAQPAGVPAHDPNLGGGNLTPPDRVALALHARLCELIPDASARAGLLGVPEGVDAAWVAGRMLPVLRAHTKALDAAVSRLEHAAAQE